MTITGLILAGGRGSRMGNVDKGLQTFGDMPLVQHVLARLKPQVGQLIVNANRNIAAYSEFGVPVCPDAIPNFAGPLAGLQAGLLHCKTPYLATVPCDAPFLPLDLVERLFAAVTANDAELAFAVTGEGRFRQPHPVFCLLKTELLPQLTEFLRHGGRKVGAWHGTVKAVEVPFSDEAAFRNINSLEDMHQFAATRT